MYILSSFKCISQDCWSSDMQSMPSGLFSFRLIFEHSKSESQSGDTLSYGSLQIVLPKIWKVEFILTWPIVRYQTGRPLVQNHENLQNHRAYKTILNDAKAA